MRHGSTPFLLSALPGLPGLGEAAPIDAPGLMAVVRATSAAPLVEAVLLGDDLLLHQSVVAGRELPELPNAVLEEPQVRGEAPLPPGLNCDRPDAFRVAADCSWASWFRHLNALARQHGSGFLADWCAWEVALRNQLVQLRAEGLGLDGDALVITPDLASTRQEDRSLVDEAVSRVQHAEDPQSQQRALDAVRIEWLDRNAPRFAFTDDEVVAYAVRLSLVLRWAAVAAATAVDG
ncbi:MAG: DUF2764 family protein [Planctomycetota bacterium]